MEGLSHIERLIAIEDIKILKARRDKAVDTKDWDTYLALHAPDHRSHNDGFPAWNSAAEMIAAVRSLMTHVISVHHSHTPRIEFESADKATGVWGMEDNIYWKQGEDDHWLRGFGFYHEIYEKLDGRWLFTFRRLERIHVLTSPGADMASAGARA